MSNELLIGLLFIHQVQGVATSTPPTDTLIIFEDKHQFMLKQSHPEYGDLLRLVQQAQERRQPLAVHFKDGNITSWTRAQQDMPLAIVQADVSTYQVRFQRYAAMYKLSTTHLHFARLLTQLEQARQQKQMLFMAVEHPALLLHDLRPSVP